MSSSSSSTASSILQAAGPSIFHAGELWMQHKMLPLEEVESGALEDMARGMIVQQISSLDRIAFIESAPFAFLTVLSPPATTTLTPTRRSEGCLSKAEGAGADEGEADGEVWCGLMCFPFSSSATAEPLFNSLMQPQTGFPAARDDAGLLKVKGGQGDAPSLIEIHWQALFSGEPLSSVLCAAAAAAASAKSSASVSGTFEIYAGIILLNFAQRRRLRINGRIQLPSQSASESDVRSPDLPTSLSFVVDQFYGNCPKYIPAREFQFRPPSEMRLALASAAAVHGLQWGATHEQIIREADSFFLGTVYGVAASACARTDSDTMKKKKVKVTTGSVGCDCSHRGGFPGFISLFYQHHHAESQATISGIHQPANACSDSSCFAEPLLMFGDYSGNRMYQSLGNVRSDGRVGLFIPHFSSCSALYLSGEASVFLSAEKAAQCLGLVPSQLPALSLTGSECIIVVRVKKCILAPGLLPFRSKLLSYSPFNPGAAGTSKDQWSVIHTQAFAQTITQNETKPRIPDEESEGEEQASSYSRDDRIRSCAAFASTASAGANSAEVTASSTSLALPVTIGVDSRLPSGPTPGFLLRVFAIRKESADTKSFLLCSPWVSVSTFCSMKYDECLPGDYAVFDFIIEKHTTAAGDTGKMDIVNTARKETRCWTLTLLPLPLYFRKIPLTQHQAAGPLPRPSPSVSPSFSSGVHSDGSVSGSDAESECRFVLAVTVKRQPPASASKVSLSCYLHDQLKLGSPLRLAGIQRTEGFSPFQLALGSSDRLHQGGLIDVAAVNELQKDPLESLEHLLGGLGLPAAESLDTWLLNDFRDDAEEQQTTIVSSVFSHAAVLYHRLLRIVQQLLHLQTLIAPLPRTTNVLPSTDHGTLVQTAPSQWSAMSRWRVAHGCDPLIFLCSGIGITPFFTMIQHMIAQDYSSSSSSAASTFQSGLQCWPPLLVLLSVRSMADLPFADFWQSDRLRRMTNLNKDGLGASSVQVRVVVSVSNSHTEARNIVTTNHVQPPDALHSRNSAHAIEKEEYREEENANKAESMWWSIRSGRLTEAVLASELAAWLKVAARASADTAAAPARGVDESSSKNIHSKSPGRGESGSQQDCHFFLCGSRSYQNSMRAALRSQSVSTTIRNSLGASSQTILHEEEFTY